MPPVHGRDKERRRGVGRVGPGPVTQGSAGEVVKQYLTAISTNTRQVVHSPRESIIMHSKSELVQRLCTALST